MDFGEKLAEIVPTSLRSFSNPRGANEKARITNNLGRQNVEIRKNVHEMAKISKSPQNVSRGRSRCAEPEFELKNKKIRHPDFKI